MVDTDIGKFKLCTKCYEISHTKEKLSVKTFNEYYKKLPFCRKCKKANEVGIKNYFFKNFILYRKFRALFGWKDFLLLILFTFLADKYTNAYLAAFILMIEYKRYAFSWLKALFLILIIYNTSEYHFLTFIYFLYSFYKIFTEKSLFFDVPINTNNTDEIDSIITRLSINSSFDNGNDLYHNTPRSFSQPNLK